MTKQTVEVLNKIMLY